MQRKKRIYCTTGDTLWRFYIRRLAFLLLIKIWEFRLWILVAGEKALKEVLRELGLLSYQIELQLLQVVNFFELQRLFSVNCKGFKLIIPAVVMKRSRSFESDQM